MCGNSLSVSQKDRLNNLMEVVYPYLTAYRKKALTFIVYYLASSNNIRCSPSGSESALLFYMHKWINGFRGFVQRKTL
ncbi:hypothetical protein SAMN05421788_11165 [Filimonas lacunae]|uniref:Uncharacterized protein n=1 Tax=Filimonas lacunae TaxID=477680 RepID=A0A1N7RAY6_9BACT|nr:hypothetical protein SAMN05421788_11165 [Filimonas lacunae]